MKKGHRLLRAIAITAAAVLLLLCPFMRLFESMAVMGVYSVINVKDSLIAKEDINISIPGGFSTSERDWYPFVMTFNADAGFSRFVSRPGTQLTIMYNFPQFDLLKGCSELYDEDSPLYSSFYGAYAVKTADGVPFGFKEVGGEYVLDESSTALVPEFDYHNLVLRDFGLNADNAVFDWKITDNENCEYLGMDGWTRIDADLTVNGCAHKYDGFVQSYLQYGVPAYECEKPLAPVDMKGRVYAKYFAEKDVSIFMYVLTKDAGELERTDEQILSKSAISFE